MNKSINSDMNILFIFTDQQRYDTLKIYGNNEIMTPNLDMLAEQSVIFKKAYVAQPICAPSRATMITGLYPHSHGLTDNDIILDKRIPTIADFVKKSGYRTGYIGKWHLGNETAAQHGFEEWISTEDYFYKHVYSDEYKILGYDREHSCYHDFLKSHGFMPDKENDGFGYFSREFVTRIPEKYSKPAFVAEKTKEYLKRHKDEKFVLYVNFLEPHPPYYSVFDEMYDPEKISLPVNFMAEPSEDIPLKYEILRQYASKKGRHEPLKDEKTWRKLIARYMGAISLVDKYVGEILNELKQSNLDENTVIVFTSDHGDMMGDFKMYGKGIMYEPAIRVPLFLKIPGMAVKRQNMINEPVNQIDLVPTLLDIIGFEGNEKLQGKSLLPVILGETKLKNNNVFIEYHDWEAVTDEKYSKYISSDMIEKARRMYGSGSEVRTILTPEGWKMTLTEAAENELYDLNSDPNERINLYNKNGFDEIKKYLRSELLHWQRETNDSAKI